jgi:YfiH family protein
MNNCEFKFFSSLSGISTGPYQSLNCAFNVGDNIENIKLNRQIICKSFSGPNKLFTVTQIHSDKVYILKDESGIDTVIERRLEADCIITKLKNILIGVTTADCVPILFHDPVAEIVGACHAGWKGAFSNLLPNMLDGANKLGSKVNNIKFWIGPAIRQKSYQVQKDFFDVWSKQSSDFKQFFQIDSEKNYYCDLSGIVKFKLKQLQIPENNIFDQEIDTFSNIEYFSYRRSNARGEQCGRNISVIKNL